MREKSEREREREREWVGWMISYYFYLELVRNIFLYLHTINTLCVTPCCVCEREGVREIESGEGY